MMSYSYCAVTSHGKKVKGFAEAETPQLLKKSLRNQGLILTSYTKKETSRLTKSLPRREKLPFVLALSQMLSAGLPLFDSLELLKNQQQSPQMKEAITACLESLRQGRSFSAALQGYKSFFDERFIAMIESGEQSGDLSDAVASLLKTLEREQAKKKKLFSLFFYPSLLLGFSLIVISVVFLSVIPSLEELFGFGNATGFSGLVFAISRLLRKNLPWILLAGASVISLFFFLRSKIMSLLEKIAFKIPLIRRMLVESSLAEFCLTLALLIKGGVPLLESLCLCEKRGFTEWQKDILKKSIKAIEEGQSFSKSLENRPYLPPLFIKMLAASEDTGTLEEVAFKLAGYFEEASQKRMEALMTLLQPLILIGMGALIAAIMLAVLLPLSDPEMMLRG